MSSANSRLMPTLRRVVLAGAGADRTDGQLLGAFVLERDAEAFGQLVRRHGPMVLGVCRRVTGDRTTADDAFQAVFIVLARRAATVKPREQVGNYLYGVAYRTALKARAVLARRRSREKQVDVMPEPPVPPSPDVWSDVQPIIDDELARLPEKLRLPVVLCDLEGRTQREVAKQLGVPPATLATRLASARRTLAQRLTKRGITLSGGVLAGLLGVHGTAGAVPHALIHGMARAAEAVAGGGAVTSLVSNQVLQLSEGVMRMMLLTKLKAVAVTALAALALTGGLGVGLMPALAGDPGVGQVPTTTSAPAASQPTPAPSQPAKSVEIVVDDSMDDATFLRRLCLDLRGTPSTDIETFFFVADDDDHKRAKVVEWLIADDQARDFVAQLQGVPANRVRVVKAKRSADGKYVELVIEANQEPKATQPRITNLAFTPDGKRVVIERNDVVLVKTPDAAGTTDRLIERKRAILRRQDLDVKNLADWEVMLQPPSGQPMQGFFQAHNLNTMGADRFLLWAAEDPKAPRVFSAGTDGGVRVWDATEGKQIEVKYWAQDKAGQWIDVGDGQPQTLFARIQPDPKAESDLDFLKSDLDFLKRVTMAARGTTPTALEERYFTEDKDPKKREKLIDSLLKEPAVAKKLGDDFKKKMLATTALDVPGKQTFDYRVVPLPNEQLVEGFRLVVPFTQVNPAKQEGFKYVAPFVVQLDSGKKDGGFLFVQPLEPKAPQPPKGAPQPPQPPVVPKPPIPAQPAPQADKFGQLIDALIAAKKTDAEMLEAVTLAAARRLPTETEKRLTLALVAKSADRKAAWLEVVKVLAADEVKDVRIKIVTGEPVPPAKP